MEGVSGSDGEPTAIFGIQHPADVNFFRNAIQVLAEEGWDIHVYVRDKDVAAEMLESYGIPHTVLARNASTLPRIAVAQVQYELGMLRAGLRHRPDVMVAQHGASVSHAATLLGSTSVVFMDTDHATLQNAIVTPFADRICTSTSYREDHGPKQVRYPYYHELAYLHPNRFTPDEAVLDEVGVSADERFVVARFVGWDAVHDVGERGVDPVDLVQGLEALGVTVLVSSEGEPPPEIADNDLDFVDDMYSLLAYADAYVGESATMASESAVLGTPAVLVNPLGVGYVDELEAEYGLAERVETAREGLELARYVLSEDCDADWDARRDRMLVEKTDATSVILAELRQAVGRGQDAP